ncbi:hypothetical protein ACFCX0_09745 [Streptomyces sp. NPDC056352]|uniref:hypothetical protein n=1 Tax=Streptomyces sp. NPDC056352 TaxID=3345791 RepID=UPI0035DB2A73
MTGTLTRIRDTCTTASRTPLRTELRRGIPLWTGAAVALTVLVTLGAKADQWQGDWGATLTRLTSANTLLCGPLTAAAACWQGGRERRARTTELLSGVPRSQLRRAVMSAAPVALWAAAGYLVALAVLLAANLPYASGRGPSLSLAVSDSCFLVSIALVGFVVGRLSPWRLTAPVLAVCTYVGLGIPNYLESEARFLSPGGQTESSVSVPVWWFAPVMVAWLGGLALTVLLGYAARRRVLAVVPLVVAVAAGSLIARTNEELWRDDPSLARRICTDDVPQICVNGREGPMLAQVSDALSGMLSRLDGVPNAPTLYVENDARPGNGKAPLPRLTLGWDVVRNRLLDPGAFARGTAAGLTTRDCPNGATKREMSESERMYHTDWAVHDWLAPEDDPGQEDSEVKDGLARLRAMPDTSRRAWLGRYLASRKSCDPAEVPTL